MKLFASLFAVVCAIILTANADENTEKTNKFVDQIIGSIIKEKHLDPLKIAQHNVTLDKKIGLIDLHVEIEMDNVEVKGLGRIHRNGDAVLKSGNGTFDVKLRLNDENVVATTDLHLKIGKVLHPNLKAEIDIGDIDIKFELAIVDGKFKLEQFEIDELKHCKVIVHGLHSLDNVVDIIADAYLLLFNKKARQQISDLLRPLIEHEIIN
ncbi:Group 7 mite allergen-like protein (lipopeptide binding protein) [Euroglyphus maynei]|uniref:Group 7 mite allergen-like protein (Lipopeptide binding protein) n=1 Tax=Euroglyphus maynei TaxID=6958 RepID=A0A1Y3B310_EURMA|nr:Group 7 mite allergen-like protein (lipopeptide binding protein) [Euroglyphus maynei]